MAVRTAALDEIARNNRPADVTFARPERSVCRCTRNGTEIVRLTRRRRRPRGKIARVGPFSFRTNAIW